MPDLTLLHIIISDLYLTALFYFNWL